MAISVARADQHIAEWRPKLNPFPARRSWAEHIFHACQIEVAVAILRRGELVSRKSLNHLIYDVADRGALWNNPSAHDYVRLYFRPRNLFHLKTEGIKSYADNHRVDPHMSVPVMLVFNFRSVLSMPDSMFVPGNFAGTNKHPLSGDTSFSELDFNQIYDDSGSGNQKQAIQNARMSEVVVRDRLSLDSLSAVVARTIHEERYLRHLLGADAVNYNVVVERHGSIFCKRGMFITEIYTRDGILHFAFRAPNTGAKPEYQVSVSSGHQRFEYNLKPQRWHIPAIVNRDPNTVWRIEIEGCAAYEGTVPATGPVVA